MVSRENLEIIQISWDKDIEGYKESTQSTPWLSLPWEQRDRQVGAFMLLERTILVLVNYIVRTITAQTCDHQK